MEYINALRFFGDNSKIHNSTFEKCNLLNIVSNNFTMLSNSFINSTDDNYQGFVRGNDTKFFDNSVTNNSAGFLLWESDNITIKHNICHNVTGHCFRFVQVNNSVIKNNNFSNKESYHSLFFEDSNNNSISNNHFYNTTRTGDTVYVSGDFNILSENYFENCGLQGYWWQECIQISGDSYRESTGNIVSNNTLINVTGSGIAITSNVNNTIIRDNLILGRTDIKSSDFGILLFMYNDDSTDRFRYSPSDTLIYNNTIRYFSNGVGCDYYGYGNWGFHNVISSNTIVDNDLGIYVWTLYDNNTIENNYIRNIQMTNSSSLGWAGIYIKSEANYWSRNTSITNNTILSHRGPGILIDNSEDLTVKNNKITVQTPKQYAGNGIMVRNSVDVKIKSNVIVTNRSSESMDAGAFLYGGNKIYVANNEIEASIGIEASNIGYSSGIVTEIRNNTVIASNYGIISNRTDVEIVNNTIVGACSDQECKIINFVKVGDFGIFTQESNVISNRNNITYFNEAFAGFLSEFNVSNSYIDYTKIAVKGSNCEIEMYNNTITNAFSSVVNIHKSVYSSVNNNYTNFAKGIDSFNSTVNILKDNFKDGETCLDLHDSEYLLEDSHLQCSNDNILVSYSLQILIADEYGLGSEEHSFEVLNSNDDVNIFAYTRDSGYSGYYVIDVYRLTPDNLEMDYNPFTLKYFNNNVPVVLVKDINYNQTVVGILDTTPPSS